jgi:hypothetical protein
LIGSCFLLQNVNDRKPEFDYGIWELDDEMLATQEETI